MLDIEHLRRKFVYVPEIGKIFRRLGDDTYFELGCEAFRTDTPKGYLVGNFQRKIYLAHQTCYENPCENSPIYPA